MCIGTLQSDFCFFLLNIYQQVWKIEQVHASSGAVLFFCAHRQIWHNSLERNEVQHIYGIFSPRVTLLKKPLFLPSRLMICCDLLRPVKPLMLRCPWLNMPSYCEATQDLCYCKLVRYPPQFSEKAAVWSWLSPHWITKNRTNNWSHQRTLWVRSM